MPDALAELAGEGCRAATSRALRRFRYGPSTLKVDWALDGPIPWSAPGGARGRHGAPRRLGG